MISGNAKFFGFCFLAWVAIQVLGAGHALIPAIGKAARGITPYYAISLLLDLWLWHSVWAGRTFNRFFDALPDLIPKFEPAQMKAWEAKSMVTLIALFGLISLVFTVSNGWVGVFTGLCASVVLGVVFWMLMSWTDTLQARSKTKTQTVWGVVQLLFVLGVGWLGFITVVLAFTQKNA